MVLHPKRAVWDKLKCAIWLLLVAWIYRVNKSTIPWIQYENKFTIMWHSDQCWYK